ncbi:MAG: hypothetical protein RR276_09550, partial [Angelakisella sp.]
KNYTLLTVASGGKLTLEQVAVDGGAAYTGNTPGRDRASGIVSDTPHAQLVSVADGGTLTLNRGAVLRNNALQGDYTQNASNTYHYGSAIEAVGNVTMNPGAEITGNMVSGYAADGAAISVISGAPAITITGGTIANNYGERLGSALRLWRGTFTMTGGEIVRNLGANGISHTVNGYTNGAVNFDIAVTIGGTAVIADN